MPRISGLHVVDEIITKYCPANTDFKLWECPVDLNHIDQVIDSAKQGFKTWKKIKLDERVNYLKNYQKEVTLIKDKLAEAIAFETGKPLWEACTEVNGVIGKVDVTINESLPRITTKSIKEIFPQTDGIVLFRPIGPCFIIGPFNFPCHLANGQILSALVAGNSIIFKPSEKTCYSAQLLIECFHKAKFPKGVVSLLHGRGETARRVLRNKAIKG
ncbi:MAG: aldehyde dehydrogenase family protein, partial [Halobacteriovoraceae bacterium]|nr:aldehyde dehydrogenase family protein [Halobacteriovoraceae bacterium]